MMKLPTRDCIPRRVPGALVFAATALAAQASGASPQDLLWLTQQGSAKEDSVRAVAPDLKGGVFAGGHTEGSLAAPVSGPRDACLLRFDGNGNTSWVRQFGTNQSDWLYGLTPDGAGGVFACGATDGALGSANQGDYDAWVARFDSSGNVLWMRQLGTAEDDTAIATAADGAGGVFVSGSTRSELGGPYVGGWTDIWVARYDAHGTQMWIRQFGSSELDEVHGAASDGTGGVFLCGATSGDMAGPLVGTGDAWIARLDSLGNIVWIEQLQGVGKDGALCAAPDGLGGVLVGGYCMCGHGGPFVDGWYDAWFGRMDSAGEWQWLRKVASDKWDETKAIVPDGHGGALVAVAQFLTTGPGIVSLLLHYDHEGVLLTQTDSPSSNSTTPLAAASDSRGGMYVGGMTLGSLVGPQAGEGDVWLARYDGSCNSGTTYCTASATSIPGCQAAVSGSGSPSLSAPSTYTISSGPVPGGSIGLLLFGSSGKDSTPYGTLGGMLCVAAPTYRTAPKQGGGDPGQCNGSYSFTLQDLLDAAPVVTSGAVIDAQVWARDPANPDGFLLSEGIEFTVCP